MAANVSPIFPKNPAIGIASLTSAVAVTSRANITGTTGLAQLTPSYTEAKRVDSIAIKAKGTTVASKLFIWIYNGTTSYLRDEMDIPVDAAGNTDESYLTERLYSNMVIPAGYQLYVSQTVQTDVNVFAHCGDY